MLRRTTFLITAVCLAGAGLAPPVPAEPTCRVYFIGNSVTDTINYRGLAELAKSRGLTQVWGRHMIPGAPLQWIWEHPTNGFQEPPFGLYPSALGGFSWDVLSLQPFDRHLEGKDGDLAMAKNFIDMALLKSPDLHVYVYARWPRQGKDGFGAAWLKKYTGAWDGTNETRDYFERVTVELRKAYPKLKIHMVPVGHVMYELDQRMKAGQVPGYQAIKDLFVDGIHLNKLGSYVAGCTFFATLYKQNPKGLPAEPYQVTDPRLAEIVQETVWRVVSANELAGVAAVAKASDPVTAIRAVLPKGWVITRVEENAHPPHGTGAQGKAIFLFSPQEKLGPMQSKESVVYLMPADYPNGGEESPQEQQYGARLILATPTAKVYLRGNETPYSSTGWRTLKDDILKALGEAPQAAVVELGGKGWTSLFNGKNLDGWVVKCRPQDSDKRGYWKVVDGTIAAETPAGSKHHYIWLLTEKEFGDFELRLKVQTYSETTGNSGIQVRSRYDDLAGWLDGPQVDINPPGPWRNGFIYDETRGVQVWLWPDVGKPANAKPEHAPRNLKWSHADKDNAWNEVTILCQGTRIKTIVNGTLVADYDGAGRLDDETHRKHNVGMKGHVGLQIHPGQQLSIRFKDLEVRESH